MICYYNGQFQTISDIKVSPFDRGFLFADGVYEAIRTYNKTLFRYDDHLSRLKRSLKETRIDFTELISLENIIYELMIKNEIENEALAYIQITRGSAIPRTHHFPEEKFHRQFSFQ